MGALYLAVPGAGSGNASTVSTGTTLKTLLQVATPSTTRICVHAWGISFDGVTSTSTPILTVLADTDVAASVTTLTPDKWEGTQEQASLCVGGASATGSNASAEGTITNAKLLDTQLVHPQAGYSIWYPERDRPFIEASRFLRVRVTAGTSVNALPWILYGEPV
jgi:hypothetical protein